MIKIVLLGAGSHSQGNHLPALAHYAVEHPGEVELAGLCDLRAEHARAMAARYGFARVYTDLDEMLNKEQPDGCVAITPIPVTREIGLRIMRAGVPLLMEKPPGATVAEAREIVEVAEQTGARVMVSMNRRFDPGLRRALDWIAGRPPVEYVRGTIIRHNRTEDAFVEGTAIHPLDAMRKIAGDVRAFETDSWEVEGIRWFVVRLQFEGGARGILEVLPTAGCLQEFYELSGPGYHAAAHTIFSGPGRVQCWEGGEKVLDEEPLKGMPDCVRNGAYGETMEFISAIREDRAPHPSPSEVLQTVELCHAIAGTGGA